MIFPYLHNDFRNIWSNCIILYENPANNETLSLLVSCGKDYIEIRGNGWKLATKVGKLLNKSIRDNWPGKNINH